MRGKKRLWHFCQPSWFTNNLFPWLRRSVGMLEKLSRLNYSPDRARPATLILLLANRGQLVMPFYSKASLFVKQNAHQPPSASAKVI